MDRNDYATDHFPSEKEKRHASCESGTPADSIFDEFQCLGAEGDGSYALTKETGWEPGPEPRKRPTHWPSEYEGQWLTEEGDDAGTR
jgi:hypothetical protein